MDGEELKIETVLNRLMCIAVGMVAGFYLFRIWQEEELRRMWIGGVAFGKTGSRIETALEDLKNAGRDRSTEIPQASPGRAGTAPGDRDGIEGDPGRAERAGGEGKSRKGRR